MELSNEFEVGVPVGEAWNVLTDVQRIAPCMPGAELREVEGDEYRGVVKVKVGPITAEYRGVARFLEKDEAAHRAVLRAEGREARGQGNANATITATLVPAGERTKVTVETDLQITGKVAQFGRGVLADVSNKLLGQFVGNLETTVLAGQAAPGGAPGSQDGPSGPQPGEHGGVAGTAVPSGAARGADGAVGPGVASVTRAEPVDLLQVAGMPVARRLLPVIAVASVVVIAVVVLRRRLR